MPALVSSIEIARAPEEVFAYATDPLRFAEWQNDVVSVRMDGDGPASLGARFTTTRRVGGAERTMTQEITRNDPPRSWAAHGVDGPIRPNVTISIEPLGDGSRSRVTFTLDFEGHGVAAPLAPFVRRMAARGAPTSYRNLKQQLEMGDYEGSP